MAQAINDKTYGCMFRFGCPCDCGEFYIPERLRNNGTKEIYGHFQSEVWR